MKKAITGKMIAVIVAVVVVVSGGGLLFANRPTPERTIKRFETAFNNLQVEDMVECFEPRVQSMYKGASALMNHFIGFSPEDMVNIALLAMPFMEEYADEGEYVEMPQIEINILDTDIDGEYATVTATMAMLVDGEWEEPEQGELYLKEIDGEWYILAE